MNRDNPVRKIINLLHSMKLAVFLLLLIVAACTAGSLIAQNQLPAYYEAVYGEKAKIILVLQLDHVFQCGWFLLLTGFLCINLILCSVLRLGVIRKEGSRLTLENKRNRSESQSRLLPACEEELKGDGLFQAMGFRAVKEQMRDEKGTFWRYSVRHKAGIWGPWLCHVGMLILIAGFGLGRIYSVEAYIYGVPGETKEVEGTDYAIQIDDFSIDLRADETVEQYTADLTVIRRSDGSQISGTAQVNHPMNAFGMRVYQNSTGWACQVDIYREGEWEDSRLLCVGEILSPESMPELSLVFQKFYPDYAMTEEGPVSVSSALNHPCAAFVMYYDGTAVAADVVGVDRELIAQPYTFVFHDPQPYTLIQVIHDPFMWLAGIGGAVILAALFLCFYLRTEELWTAEAADGTTQVWMYSRKGELLMEERYQALMKTGKKTGEGRETEE